MHKSRVFLYTLLMFVGGVGVRSFSDVPRFVVVALGVIAAFLIVWWLFEQERCTFGFIGLLLIIFVFGMVRFSMHESAKAEATIQAFADGRDVILQGIVVDEPDVREKNTRLVVESSELLVDTATYTVEGRVLVFTDRYPSFSYGDEIIVTGALEKPEPFNGFDYPSYLAKDTIYTLMYYPEMELVSAGGYSVHQVLFDIKRYVEHAMSALFPEPHAAFLKGIMLGSRSSIPDWLLEAFRVTGVIHIIALSGFNITIIADNLMRILRWATLGPQWSFWVSLVVISFFTIMVGASPSIVRAAFMGVLVLLARKEGRMYTALNALVFVGAVMVFHNPAILRFDVAFQLSFLATAGLLFFTPRIERALQFLPTAFGFRGNLSSTLGAQAAVLPLIVFYFGTVSFMSIPANVLILSVIPTTMLFGFLAVLAGIVSKTLGIGVGFAAYLLSSYVIFIADIGARFPFAAIEF